MREFIVAQGAQKDKYRAETGCNPRLLVKRASLVSKLPGIRRMSAKIVAWEGTMDQPGDPWKKLWIRFRLIPENGSEASVSDEFSTNVAASSALLNFLIKEGVEIRDQIIDDIEAARELASNSASPSKEDRAKLLKAYRDLAAAPRISVAAARIPPVTFWSVDSQWPSLLIWFSAIPSIVALIVLLTQRSTEWYWHWPLIYLVLSALTISGLYVFTGIVTNNKLNQIIRFCYIFTGIALVGSLLPFIFPGLFPEPTTAPLGILRGCAKAQADVAREVQRDVPKEVQCQGGGIQWVVRLGGTVGGAAATGKPSEQQAAPTAPGATPPTPKPGEQQGAPTAPGAIPPTPKPGEQQGAPTPPGATPPAPKPGEQAAPTALGREIISGLVVPLYVIILALVGGAISMTRRVPEYQRRAMDSRDPLTNAEAREFLVFQIMQVATAPLLAVTAYYIVRPDSPLESVVVGFGSGFASEPILVMIRALVDKLKPATQASPQSSPISVTVTPSSTTVPPGKTMQFNAKVSGSPNSEVTWLIDPPDVSAGTISQSGYYAAPASPPPPTKAITITARSVADPTKSASAGVKVEPIVKVTPESVTLRPGQTQQFKAEVSGLPRPDVEWSIDLSGAGTISNGLYTAPSSITAKTTVTITARSVADATRFGSAKVTLEP